MSGLSNTLGDLLEVRGNTRSLVEETYQSYRAVLEQCKNVALMDLEEKHNQRDLAIMEKLEHYDITKSCPEQAMTYTEQLVSSCSAVEQQQLEGKVVNRIWEVLPPCSDPQHWGHLTLVVSDSADTSKAALVQDLLPPRSRSP